MTLKKHNTLYFFKIFFIFRVIKNYKMADIIKKSSNNFSNDSVDEKMFKRIYYENYNDLCVFLLNYTNDRDLIKDIVQETFLKIWNSRHKISISTSLKNYLRKSVYNNFIDNYRIQKKRNFLLEAYYKDIVDEHFETDTDIINEMIDTLNMCIDKLPKKCKEVLILSKIKGFKFKELSKKLKISKKTIEGHTTRAYAFLKDCLKKSHPSLV